VDPRGDPAGSVAAGTDHAHAHAADRQATVAEPERGRMRRAAVTPPSALRILFQHQDDGAFLIDGLASDDDSVDAIGRPVALVLRRPDAHWVGEWMAALLESWAEEGTLVHLRVKKGRTGPVAVLDVEDEGYSLRLDLIGAG